MRDDRTGIRGYGGIRQPDGVRPPNGIRAEAPLLDRGELARLRLDCGPQPGLRRAVWLRRLGGASAVLGLASFYPLPAVSAALAVPLGAAAWLLARRDAAAMRTGRRNRRWLGLTRDAQARGLDGLVFSATGLAFWTAAWLMSGMPWPF
jgi:hypothetical protein